MGKQMILHDLHPEQMSNILGDLSEDIILYAADCDIQTCIGCFNCWLKTPGICSFGDKAQALPSMIAASEELIIVSRNLYGGFSPCIKGSLDRSIGYIMPFFRILQGEMHHTMRYENPFLLKVHFYGTHITEADKSIARKLVPAVALNFGAKENEVQFHESVDTLKEVLS